MGPPELVPLNAQAGVRSAVPLPFRATHVLLLPRLRAPQPDFAGSDSWRLFFKRGGEWSRGRFGERRAEENEISDLRRSGPAPE